MKFLIVFVALFALAVAAPAEVEIVRQVLDVQPDSYKEETVLSDGTSSQSEGVLNNVGTEQESLAVKGSYSFVADDGVTYTVNYIADENGFQPQGAHLPVA
ncbi:larval cuticle protein 65Ag1 [Drosophila mojavensis]|uniref:Larval cuticle protein 8 n=2 Tax=mojavensis species complex TaxID=198037 RepID=B4KWN9_DROMO|nr:larval cuticle protein 65Ag1 [Drosophila mojavensis]XP_017861093.1 PREDICTED: larval cuticle protein 8-like [Drosophila arizonae]EDW17486.1 uncharacterized protein Dmoj_GI12696 [Drosophila mojavensis]